jgi:ribosome-associated protein
MAESSPAPALSSDSTTGASSDGANRAPSDGADRPAGDQATEALARLAAEACDDRKAVDIRLIRVDEVSSLADWFVICSGLSDVQVRAIARSVEDRLEEATARLPLRQEGQREGSWIVLDYGEVIVHVLTPQERSYYDLEAFWGHGEQVRYVSPVAPAEGG